MLVSAAPRSISSSSPVAKIAALSSWSGAAPIASEPAGYLSCRSFLADDAPLHGPQWSRAYGFVARVLTGPTVSPLGQLVTRVMTTRLGVAAKPVPGRRSFSRRVLAQSFR